MERETLFHILDLPFVAYKSVLHTPLVSVWFRLLVKLKKLIGVQGEHQNGEHWRIWGMVCYSGFRLIRHE